MFGMRRRDFVALLGSAAAWPLTRGRSTRAPAPDRHTAFYEPGSGRN